MKRGMPEDFRLPPELSAMFDLVHFKNYPLVAIPQIHGDNRGSIKNIADGILGDVAIIECNAMTLRANHIHKKDWHLTYVVSGSMEYHWAYDAKPENRQSILLNAGEMVLSLAGDAHLMCFKEESVIVAISALSRKQNDYEDDLIRLSDNFFQITDV
jgi:hypothetical protein